MTDIPVIFSGPMVRALLDGRKTMTRRLALQTRKTHPSNDSHATYQLPSPWQKAEPGDRLWVREAFCRAQTASHPYVSFENYNPLKPTEAVMHREGCWDEWPRESGYGGWKPSIHMPRWASRLTLTITATKVERLQDISTADVYAEGAVTDDWLEWREDVANIGKPPGSRVEDERDVWKRLWESLHGTESWDANPEVVALTFTVHKANIDQMDTAA